MPALEERAPASDPEFSFADVAGWYDRLNRLMSFGRDQHWRRLAAVELQPGPGSLVLDVGTGTGQMALAVRKHWPSSQVVALDTTIDLLGRARKKPFSVSVRWMLGDTCQLPFPDGWFDAVVSVFLLRNVGDVEAALAEQRRVVRPPASAGNTAGGRVVSLELVWPRWRVFGSLFRLYFGRIMPALNGLLSGSPEAYAYLPRSVEEFDSPQELAAKMKGAGLTNVRYRTLALGTVALHVGERGV
jgi:demethylmenaquinone methyltransferase/2-methoxy-6-polyprenyl-1,4-benzoquinol methylase